MKILFVCSAKVWGGNEKWTSIAMRELNKNHKVFLYYRNKKLGYKFGKTIHKSTAPFYNLFDPITYIRIAKFIKQQQIDIIISTKKKEYFICGILSKIFRIKNILRLGIERNLTNPLWHKIIYNTLCDGIIVNANSIKKNLSKYKFINLNKIKVIYNGIEFKSNLFMPSKKSDEFSISSVGMLTKRKGFHHLIEAIHRLPLSIRENVKLNIIGSGRYEKVLSQKVKNLDITQNVKFWGFQENPLEIVAGTDLFVLLSSNEGISNALIEAMLIGKPILTTDTGSASEFIINKKNGFIIHSIKPDEIVNLLTEIIQNKYNLSEIGKSGSSTVKKIFSLENMRNKLDDFLQLVSSGSSLNRKVVDVTSS